MIRLEKRPVMRLVVLETQLLQKKRSLQEEIPQPKIVVLVKEEYSKVKKENQKRYIKMKMVNM